MGQFVGKFLTSYSGSNGEYVALPVCHFQVHIFDQACDSRPVYFSPNEPTGGDRVELRMQKTLVSVQMMLEGVCIAGRGEGEKQKKQNMERMVSPDWARHRSSNSFPIGVVGSQCMVCWPSHMHSSGICHCRWDLLPIN